MPSRYRAVSPTVALCSRPASASTSTKVMTKTINQRSGSNPGVVEVRLSRQADTCRRLRLDVGPLAEVPLPVGQMSRDRPHAIFGDRQHQGQSQGLTSAPAVQSSVAIGDCLSTVTCAPRCGHDEECATLGNGAVLRVLRRRREVVVVSLPPGRTC